MSYVDNFIGAIIENSVADDYPRAKKEWTYHGEQFDCEPGEISHCICGHVIRDNRIIRNQLNHRSLVVGNCCINKFELERKAFNGSKMDYLELGLQVVKTPGARDYLKFDTLPRIKNGEMFNLKDLEVLESVTGKHSRFKAKEHSAKQQHEEIKKALEQIRKDERPTPFRRMRERRVQEQAKKRQKRGLFDF